MEADEFWIPRTLDAPTLFFVWEVDVAALWITCLLLGCLLHLFLPSVAIAVVLGRAYARLKEEGGKGLILRTLYWFTPSSLWAGRSIASHVREYVGG